MSEATEAAFMEAFEVAARQRAIAMAALHADYYKRLADLEADFSTAVAKAAQRSV